MPEATTDQQQFSRILTLHSFQAFARTKRVQELASLYLVLVLDGDMQRCSQP